MVNAFGRKTSAIYTKHLTRSRNIWNQRSNFKPRIRGRQPYQNWEQYPEADFPVDFFDFGEYDNITRPRNDGASRLRRQFRDNPPGKSPRLTPKWIYRPRPKDKEDDESKPLPTFPEFPDIPPTEEPSIPIPGQDLVLDDPFTPIEESEEAEDEGEQVKDPGRDQFPAIPTCSDNPREQALYNIPPCSKNNEGFTIQTPTKFRSKSKNGKAYRKGRYGYYAGQTGIGF